MELHPAIVHFPIALSLTAALLFAPSLIQRLAAVYLALMLLSAGLVGVNGYLARWVVFREGVGVEKSKISVAPDKAGVVPSGRERKNGRIRGDDSRD